MSRPDGRPLNAVRQLHVVCNALGNSHSSATVEVGGTRVVCAVRPPQQLMAEYRGTRGRVSCVVHRAAFANAQFTRDNGFKPVSVERDISLALEGVVEQVMILEKVPQLHIEATIEILSDDGGLWDAMSTALSAALAAGGFELYDTFSAASAALMGDGTVVLDPTAAEEHNAKAVATVCVSLAAGEVHYVHQVGVSEAGTVMDLLRVASQAALSRKEEIMKQMVAS